MRTSVHPYDLQIDGGDSGRFYEVLSGFSRELLGTLTERAGDELGLYAEYLRTAGERPRSVGEYAIEFLTLGLALSRYGGAAQSSSRLAVSILQKMYRLRCRYPMLKSVVDPARGVLAGVFLVPKIGAHDSLALDCAGLQRLINWLDATGEFDQEVKRLALWSRFFETLPSVAVRQTLEKALALFEDFTVRAEEALGGYTRGVACFLVGEYRKHRWLEDQIFCGKVAVEYHLNMVAAEIVNWGLRNEFLQTPRRAVLVPGCMRQLPVEACRARESGGEIACAGCNPACRVNHVTKLGSERGFEVFIVPHSTSFTQWLRPWENTREFGIVAVACVSNILAGGYQMRELNIPSQCVLLDYPGCRKHWHPEGVSTGVNIERLEKVVAEGDRG